MAYSYTPLIKYIVEVNTDGQAYDIEIYARDAAEAKSLVCQRKDLRPFEATVRGEAGK